jgi:arabinogalactan oligomer/maltooligosaccharide transport system substrate-binding protein
VTSTGDCRFRGRGYASVLFSGGGRDFDTHVLNRRIGRVGTFVVAVATATLVAASPVTASHRNAAAAPIVIWVSSAEQTSIAKSAAAWAKSPVAISVHDFAAIRNELATANPATAPDIVVGQNDWLGGLVGSGLLLPLYPSTAVKRQFPQYTLDAFSYGIALKKLYAAPYAFENVALVVNTGLVKLPRTFAQLEREAIAFKKRKSGNLAIAVPESSPDEAAYYMHAFFSGLGGYIFGKNKVGLLDASDIGVANRSLVANSALVDRWNRQGLVSSKLDYNTAKNAFLDKHAAFWITGPWEAAALKSSGLTFKVIQVPKIKLASVPFLRVEGLMVTKYATGHGVDTLARDFVSSYMLTPAAQLDLAQLNARMPANTRAAADYKVSIESRFGRAGLGGVPVPNIPQMSSVWTDLGLAWTKSTQGVGATRASFAFKNAARNIREKIG